MRKSLLGWSGMSALLIAASNRPEDRRCVLGDCKSIAKIGEVYCQACIDEHESKEQSK